MKTSLIRPLTPEEIDAGMQAALGVVQRFKDREITLEETLAELKALGNPMPRTFLKGLLGDDYPKRYGRTPSPSSHENRR